MAVVSVVVVNILTIPPNVTVFLAFEAAFIWAMYLSRVSFLAVEGDVLHFLGKECVECGSEGIVGSTSLQHGREALLDVCSEGKNDRAHLG